MDRNVRILRRRSDRELITSSINDGRYWFETWTYGVPLETRYLGDLDEQPLTSGVFKAGLDNPQLHSTLNDDQLEDVHTQRTNLHTTGMNEHFRQASGSSGTVFTVHTLAEVDDSGPYDESPTQVTQAMLSRVEWERGDVGGFNSITYETSGGVSEQTEHEKECQVMCVPKCLKALIANLPVGGRVHENHDEEHEMASDSSRLLVVDI